jgi:hypothetical protein
MDVLKRAKAIWMRHGAQDFRVNQVYTGEFTGQLLVVVVYPDWATYASAQAKAAPEMQPLFEETAKLGGVLHERMILLSVDV